MLYVSSTLAIVGQSEKGSFSNRRVTFWNTEEDMSEVELSYSSQVMALRMNSTRYFYFLIFEGLLLFYKTASTHMTNK